jgi:hypothetical protein
MSIGVIRKVSGLLVTLISSIYIFLLGVENKEVDQAIFISLLIISLLLLSDFYIQIKKMLFSEKGKG